MRALPYLSGLLCFAMTLSFTTPSLAQLRLSRLFGDGMVMQRGVPVPVWGEAAPGAQVVVTFDGARHTARAGADGQWSVRLPAMEVGGPHEMTVAAGAAQHHVRDILVGDVWVASGQSNMEWSVADARDAAQEIAAAGDRAIRHFKVPLGTAEAPVDTVAGGSWEVADPATVGRFSAVGYFFARSLREHVDVPIGLLNATWGGTRIEPWMTPASLGLTAEALQARLEEARAAEERVRQALLARVGDLPAHDPGLVDGQARWADPALDDGAWDTLRVPGLWELAGFEGMDGVAWYRTTFDLTAEEAKAGIRLGLGTIDDADISWVNGHEVGRTNGYNLPRLYEVPASALRPGANTVAVRVEDTGGGGGIYGDASLLFVEAGGVHRPLAGTWRFKVGTATINPDGRRAGLPTLIYNRMIHPLLPFPIKGVLWYQGESNADRREDALAYRDLFPRMITGWREAWGLGDVPFLFVQLANFMEADAEPADASWPLLREAQGAALALPATGQAVIIDIGDPLDIHPRNKQDVGLRLALAARKVAYGTDLVYSGPAYRSHQVRDGRVEVAFDHTGGGLVSRGAEGAVVGFAVAGPDQRFVWADARIEGDRVVVWSDRVPNPVAVRYAWANNPEGANLYNLEGLPAAPFRTDRW